MLVYLDEGPLDRYLAELVLADIGIDASIPRGLGRVRVERAELVPDPMSRCWCCGDLLDVRGLCPLCDYEGGMVSPPHACAKSGRRRGT